MVGCIYNSVKYLSQTFFPKVTNGSKLFNVFRKQLNHRLLIKSLIRPCFSFYFKQIKSDHMPQVNPIRPELFRVRVCPGEGCHFLNVAHIFLVQLEVIVGPTILQVHNNFDRLIFLRVRWVMPVLLDCNRKLTFAICLGWLV